MLSDAEKILYDSPAPEDARAFPESGKFPVPIDA